MMTSLKSFAIKQSISVAAAVFIAVCIHHYIAFSSEYWIIIVAFLVSIHAYAKPVRLSFSFFAIICVALVLASLFAKLPVTFLSLMIASIFIVEGCWLFNNQPIPNTNFYFFLYFPLVLSVAILGPFHEKFVQYRLIDAGIGLLVGILAVRLIPIKVDKVFRQSLVPLLKNLLEYSEAMVLALKKPELTPNWSEKFAVQNTLLEQPGDYPEWVFEVGFNPGLRSGLRFFLLHLEYVTDLFFALQALLLRTKSILQSSPNLTKHLILTMENNQLLLQGLLDYLADNSSKESAANFTDDMIALEAALREVVPGSLELLDLSPEYIELTAVVRDIKDIRKNLFDLITSLPK